MTFTIPPAVRLAETIAADIELAVTKFRRDHRYTFGAKLRGCAWTVLTTADKAARKPDLRAALVTQLVDEVDDLKRCLELGHKLRLFASFGQFDEISRRAMTLGQQVGGWYRAIHPKGQNDQAVEPDQSAKTLSTHAASIVEVNT